MSASVRRSRSFVTCASYVLLQSRCSLVPSRPIRPASLMGKPSAYAANVIPSSSTDMCLHCKAFLEDPSHEPRVAAAATAAAAASNCLPIADASQGRQTGLLHDRHFRCCRTPRRPVPRRPRPPPPAAACGRRRTSAAWPGRQPLWRQARRGTTLRRRRSPARTIKISIVDSWCRLPTRRLGPQSPWHPAGHAVAKCRQNSPADAKVEMGTAWVPHRAFRRTLRQKVQ